jgi:hypothetical protein
VRGALWCVVAEGGTMRQWRGEEWDDPDKWGPPISEGEETRRESKIHKPEGKTYLREYTNGS